MKKLKAIAVSVLLLALYLHSGAQEQPIPINEPDYNKPRLFSDLPEQMDLKLTEMDNLFQYPIGSDVSINAADNFLFKGTVVSRSDEKENSLQSIVIRSSNRKGAVLTFSRAVINGEEVYMGRIMSMKNGDTFEIIKEKGKYILKKKDLYDMISE